MSAYVIVDITVTNPELYAEYIRVAPESIARFGGRYIARGGQAECLEGPWQPRRLVILEFDTYERAKAWWASAEYSGPKKMRQAAATTKMVVVAGIDA